MSNPKGEIQKLIKLPCKGLALNAKCCRAFSVLAFLMFLCFKSFAFPIDLVTNGDFSDGRNGFSSDYDWNGFNNGDYDIDDEPGDVNNAFYDFYDHTVGTSAGEMLIANGSTNSNDDVWQNNFSVTSGQTYTLSFWYRNAYNGNLSTLGWTANGSQIGSTVVTNNSWQKITVVYTATSTGTVTFAIKEFTQESSGNIFAIDDVSILTDLPATCSGTFSDTGGSGGNYSNYEDYTTTYCASPGNNIRFTFTSFSLENRYDYLRIYDGTSVSDELFDDYTGNSSPGTITSTEGCLTIRFTSDYSVNESGWIANISCVPDPSCSDIDQVLINDLGGSSDIDITGGATLYTGQLPINWNIEATGTGSVGSMEFQVTGDANQSNIESAAPYRMPTDAVSLNWGVGTYSIKVTQYSESGGNGNVCAVEDFDLIIDDCAISNLTASSNSEVCTGETLNLSVSGGGSGAVYSWTGPNSFSSSSQNPSIANIGAAVSGNYVVTATNSGCSATASTNVSVNIAPNVTVTSQNANCGLNNGEITFSFPDQSGRTGIEFSTNNGSSYGNNVNDNIGSTTIGGFGPGTYEVWTRWGNNECPVDLGSVSVARVSGTLNTSNSDPTICLGESSTLGVSLLNGVGSVSYSWSNGLGTGSNKNVTPNSNITYSITATDSEGCTATNTIAIVVNNLPTVSIGSNSPVCAGGTINLTSAGGNNYAWTGPNSFSSNNQNPSIASVSPSNSGVYNLTVTDANSCSNNAAVNVVINSGLTVTAGVADSKICSGYALNLNASGANTYTWTGPNGFSSNSQNPTINSSTVTSSGVYTVTGTNTNSCTATATTSVTVVANNRTANNDGPKCVGSTINLTASGGDTYSWAGPNGFSSSSSNPSIANATLSNEGIYTVTVSINDACSETATTELTLYSLPNVSVTDPGTICQYDDAQLQASGGVSYAWVGPNSFSSNQQNPTVSNITNAKTGIYTVTVTNASSCSASATTELSLSFPSLVVSSDTALCAGGTINLNASGGIGYSWVGPNSFSSSSSSISIASASSSESGVYTVTVNNSLGCTATTGINVTILSTSDPILTLPSICTGDSLKLEMPGWTNYSWTGPSSFSSSDVDAFIVNSNTSNSGVYSVTVNVAGCTTTATTSVTVRALPAPVISSNEPICLGTSLNLSTGSQSSYTWKGPDSFTSSAQNPVISVSDSLVQGIYTLSVVDTYGCIDSTTHDVDVSVVYPTANNSGISCLGDNVTLNATGGSTYSWTGPNSYSSNSQNPVLSSITASDAGIYSVTVTDANGCTGTATTEIVVSIPTASATTNGPVCEGSTLILSGSNADLYDWSGPNSFTSSLRIPQINNVTLTADGVYTFTVTDSVSCTATASVIVVINPLPTVSTSNNGPTCQGQTLNLTASGGNSYSWAGPNGFLSSSQNPTIASVPAGANGIYTVQVTDINNCSSISTMDVTVNPAPTPVASATIADICVGQTLELLGSGGGTYAWTGPNSFSSSQEDPNRSNGTTDMTGIYTLVVTTVPQGCTASATVAVSVNTIPDPPIVSDVERCGPGTVTITASGCSGIYSWYSTNSSSTVLGTGASFTSPSLSSDRNYYVDCTEFTCPSSTRAEVFVDILPVPTATASVTQRHCKGSTAKFTGGGNNVSSYSWSGPTGWSSPAQSPTFLITENSDAGTYTITTTRSNGCTATATTNLTVVNNCNNICDQQYVIIPSNPAFCTSNTGQVTISATNEYQTSLDGVNWYRGSHTFGGLGVGNYFFYVRDYATQNICKNVNNTLVSTTSSYFTGADVDAASDCYAANGSIQLEGVRQSDDVTWLATLKGASVPISTLDNSTIENLTPGLYYVKVARANEFCYAERYIEVPNNGTDCTSDVFCDDDSVPNLFPNGDFGSGTDENGPVLTETQYGYSNYTCYSPWDSFYSIVYETDCDNNNHQAFQFSQATGWWDILEEDHTPGDTQGYMMVINAGYTPNIVIEKEIGDLCPNTQYNFTAWMRNISPDSPIQPDAAFIIDGVIMARSGEVRGTSWQKVGFSFKTGDNTTSALFALRNIAPGGFGNNWILDDIKVSKCPLEIELSGTTVACLGGDSEEINASIGDPYSEHTFFKWQKSDDNGATWDEVTAVAEGTYVSGVMDVSLTLPTPIVSALSGRIYRIRLATTESTIDDPQCSVYSALTQIIVPPIEVVVTEDQVKCIGSGEVTLEAIPSGGNAPYTFEWDNGLPTTATVNVNPSISTDYIVTVRDSSGCPVTDTINVTIEDQPTLTVSIGPDSVCVDGLAGITAHVVGGSGDFDFTWFSTYDTTGTWTEIVGEKDSVYHPETSVAHQIYYRVFVEDLTFDCNDALSNAVLFNVVDDPITNLNLTDVSLCLNGNVELIPTITGGTGQFEYQWEYSLDGSTSWTAMPEDTLANLTVPSDAVKVEYYRLTTTSDGNGCDSPPSDVARIEVLPIFDVDVSLIDNVVCIDGLVVLHADTSSGSGTITYQWSSSSDGSNFSTISGATDSTYSPVTSAEGLMYYQVEATASGIGCGNATSDIATVTVLPEFSVDVTVNNPLVCIGGAVELVADTTNGTGTVTYQWFDSTDDVSFSPIAGATDSNYVAPTATEGITYYRVEATADGSGCGTVVSPSVPVEVLPVFSVEIAVNNSIVCVGGMVEILADTTNGTGTVTYQWFESDDNSVFTLVPGETDSLLSVNTSVEGTRYYYVEATASGSGCGTVRSATATVEVLPVFEVEASLLSNTVCIGGAVLLNTDTTSGTGTVTYQWFSSTDGSSFNPVTDSTRNAFVPVTSAEGMMYYQVQATSSGEGCGTATSDDVTVTVLPIFDVEVSVNNAVVCIGGAVQLEADTVNGTGNITYQWLSSTDNSSFNVISGATDSVYVPNTSSEGILYYQVQATASGSGCGTVTSASASVEVLPVFSVDVTLASNTVCVGGTVELVADTVNGTGVVTYQWFESSDNSTFTPISGETDSNLIANTASVGITYYRIEATASGSGCGTVSSNSAFVEVLPVFDVDVTLLSNTVCIGGAVKLSADTTSGSGNVTYQWYESSNNSTFTPISGETDSIYYPNTSAVGSLYYRVQATAGGSGCGTVDSDNATVTVLPIFDVEVNVNNAVVCIGGAVQLEADTINGTGTVTYQWFESSDNSTFTPISGATDSVYLPNTSSEGIIYYQVQATASGSGCGTVTSASASVEVLPVFSVEVALLNNTVCLGGAVRLVADTTNGTGTVTYQWFSSSDNSTFTLMPGETDSALTANTSSEGITYYYIEATASGSGCGTVRSATASVEVLPVFEVDVSLDDNIVCQNGLVQLTSGTTSGTGTVTYQWFSSSDGSSFNPITDSTEATLIPSTASVDTLYYRLEATASGVGCGTAVSDIASVAVQPQLSIDVVPGSSEVCLGSPVTFEGNPQNGVGNITYQWQAFNGVTWQNIGSETDSVYSPSTAIAGQYQYRINSFADGVGCTDASSAPAILIVNDYPDVAVSNTDPLCIPNNGQIAFSFSNETYQDTIQFSIDGGLTYPYFTYDSLSTYSIDTLSAGTYQVFARWGDSSCPIDLGNVDLEERPAPAASVTYLDPTCTTDNGQITFTFADEATRTQIEFSLDGGVTYETPVNDNSGSVTYASLAPATYDLWVRWANDECPVDLADVTLTDHPGPVLTVSADTTICFGSTALLTASSTGGDAPIVYSWNNGLPNGNSHTVSPAADASFIVVATDSNGCTSEDTILIRVNPLPVISMTGGEYCEGDSVFLTVTGGDTYAWTGPKGFTSTIQNPSIGNVDTTNSGFYIVQVTDLNSCQTIDSVNVIVNPAPEAPIVTNANRCGPGVLTLTASGCSGTITWFDNQFSNSIVGFGTTFETKSLVATANYFASCTSTSNCESFNRALAVAEIRETSNAEVITVNSTCVGEVPLDNGILIATGFREGETYSFSEGSTFDASTAIPATPAVIPSNGRMYETIDNPSGVTTYYTVRILSRDGCPVDHTVEFERQCDDCLPFCEPASINKVK
ncbi:CUB domain-containing protein [uncultured Arcticibacterium sp.]|uniref:Ig-like domain-containing protein n=1 Tax=uncultured Arcticibacterium sp. TaxID=2173042 RepID=UPI0030FC4AE9